MTKSGKGLAMSRLQAAARLSRTALASRLLAHGFYPGQEQVMLCLFDEDGQTPGQLATKLGVRPPTVTKTINRLQSQGFVQKRSSDTDARQANVMLTEAGHDAIRSIEKALRKTEKMSFRGFDKKEQKLLAKLLARVEANLLSAPVADGLDEEPDEAD